MRHKSHRYAACNTAAALARRKAGNEARSISRPAPLYPADDAGAPTGEYVEILWRGQFVRLDLGRPYPPGPGRRPRCDQASVKVGDQVLLDAGGLVTILAELRAQVTARAMSLREIDGLQTMWTERDEADAIEAHISARPRQH